jgi:peptide-methionine (R)-S-oxide reductase
MKYPLRKLKPNGKKNWEKKYRVYVKEGTERPHTELYNLHYEQGTYCCGACSE